MSDAEEAKQAEAGRVERLAAELRSARRLIGKLQAERDSLEEVVAKLVEASSHVKSLAAPPKPMRARKSTKASATAVLLLSDLHLDEVVNANEVGGWNEYNRDIAERRLARVFNEGLHLVEEHLKFRWDGAVVILAGDIVSGFIHEELTATNADTVLGTVVHWVPILADHLATWADKFPRLHVVGVVGNHGRMTQKWEYKQTVRSNLDWLIYRWLMERLSGNEKITWQVPESPDTIVELHGVRYLVTHGNAFRGGDGQIGPLGPALRGHLRTQQRQVRLGEPYDWMVMGHWHTYTSVAGVIINGSLKGLDEFAYQRRYSPEPPQQAFWVASEQGVICSLPILGDELK